MNAENFACWLNGFIKLNEAHTSVVVPTESQWEMIKEHLSTVLTKVIAPPLKEKASIALPEIKFPEHGAGKKSLYENPYVLPAAPPPTWCPTVTLPYITPYFLCDYPSGTLGGSHYPNAEVSYTTGLPPHNDLTKSKIIC